MHTYTTPLAGVTVTLYGSNSSASVGSYITSTAINSNGWYGLEFDLLQYNWEYYNIVETNPSGYTSVGATSVSGTVIISDQIQYTRLTGTLTGNKFWDEKTQAQTTNNPPVAEAGGPYACNAGGSITFDGSGSYDPDTGDSIIRYEWDLDNDGTYDETGVTWTKTYPTAKSGTVRLRVTDTHGAQGTDTATYTVSEGQQSAGAIYGTKFDDTNGNGVWESTESGLAGWLIGLRGTSDADPSIPVVGTATTDTDGKYSFTGVDPGTYTISETSQNGWTQTCPASPGTYTVTVASGQAVSKLDFGNTQSTTQENLDCGDAPLPYPEAGAELGGPWLGNTPPDAESGMQRNPPGLGDDNNGTNDESAGDWVLFDRILYKGTGHLFAVPFHFAPSNREAVVGVWIDWNGNGNWTDPGEAVFLDTEWNTLFFLSPLAFVFVVPNNAKTGTTFLRIRTLNNNDPWTESTLSSSGPSGPGEVEDHEVEIREGGSPLPPGGFILGGKINDLNGNGWSDPFEPDMPDWSIWLDMNGNGKYDGGVDQVAQTHLYGSAKGFFIFTGLADGTYIVGEIPKPGWVQTFPGAGGTHEVKIKNGIIYSVDGDIKSAPEGSSVGILFMNHQTNSPGSALKWYQPPLRHPEKQEERCHDGWGELSMDGSVTVADDWFCYSPRPVTSITWWGSYAGWDSLAPPPNAPQKFHIGVWSDVPKGKDRDWSCPGKLIRAWYVDRSQLGERPDKCNQMPEWMANPDSTFKYTYSIAAADQFTQEGDSTVYWLSVSAVYTDPPREHVWGWLTREKYFNDNPVRIYAPVEIHPDSLFRIGETLPENWDMAFELGTDQNAGIFDFGDATDELNTTLSHNGALHLIRHDVVLGQTVDAEDDGQPHPEAKGDDGNGSADEEGVAFLTDLVPGNMARAAATVSAKGYLNAWLDINRNGKWEPREHAVNNLELEAGNRVVEYPVVDDAVPGESVMRFRFSTRLDVWVKGFAIDGEVEDYGVVIGRRSGLEERKSGTVPDQFRLYANYPNPFNPSTTIRFDLPEAAQVRLSVYNLLGQEVAVLADEKRPSGQHDVRWDGLNARHVPVPSGIYLVRLEAGSFVGKGKLLLLK